MKEERQKCRPSYKTPEKHLEISGPANALNVSLHSHTAIEECRAQNINTGPHHGKFAAGVRAGVGRRRRQLGER